MSKLSVRQMLLNFKDEVIQYARAGAPHVSGAAYESRLSTCASCPHLEEYRCGMCGCVIEEKAKWATSNCPDNRWEDEGKNNNSEASQ
jgi:hypothetical protein